MVGSNNVEKQCQALALDVVGDRWGFLIIEDALRRGVSSFADFQRALDVPPAILAARIDGFLNSGLMTLSRHPHHLDQYQYELTPKGLDLEPAITALSSWGERWAGPLQSRPSLAATLVVVASEDVDHPLVVEISVLGTFAVRVGGHELSDLPSGSQRVLVFLALHDRAVGRVAMAGTMWPDASDIKAGISLRSALSRLDAPTREAIVGASAGLRLAETVTVDLRNAQALAQRLLRHGASPKPADLNAAAVASLSLELLPDWYDDWVLAEAEDWRQLRMNALEVQAQLLINCGRLAEAAGAARAAMRVEPLRESAHATLVRVHIAEGNQSEALRVFDRYRVLLAGELGLEPTPILADLVSAIRA